MYAKLHFQIKNKKPGLKKGKTFKRSTPNKSSTPIAKKVDIYSTVDTVPKKNTNNYRDDDL